MPVYEVEKGGKVYEVDAPDPQSAAKALERMGQPSAPAAPAEPERTWGDTARDVAVGAAKGLGSTVFGLGKIVHDYTPVGRISDAIQPGAFNQKPPELVPTNTPQKIGHAIEQIGEFFVPVGAAGKVGKAAEVGKAALLTRAQGGTGADVGVSAGLTAAIPVVGSVAQKAAGALRRGAEKSVVQALGPTKEAMKATAQQIAPEMIERGVKGSRGQMLAQADKAVQSVGAKIGAALDDAEKAGTTIPGLIIRGDIQLSRDALKVRNAAGELIPIAGTEGVIARLDKMDDFVAQLGDDISVKQAAAIKRTWDRIVSKAGLYGPKATATATDAEKAWAIREGAGAFRTLLNSASPTLADLNREYTFWKGLKTVLTETEKRTQAHGGGLVSGITGAAGLTAGFASGQSMSDRVQNAVLGGLAGRQLVKLMQSPWFRTAVAAPVKANLAAALSNGNAEAVERAIKQGVAALPAQYRAAMAQ